MTIDVYINGTLYRQAVPTTLEAVLVEALIFDRSWIVLSEFRDARKASFVIVDSYTHRVVDVPPMTDADWDAFVNA